MSNKVERALHGPSWTEVILGAVLAVLLGIVMGAALLVLRPVIVAKEPAKEPVPGAIYFIEGSREPGRARQALAKRKQFVEGQSVTVTEDEINALASPTAAPKAPAKPGEKAGEAPAEETVAIGAPNVRIREGTVQVGVPVTINVLGLGHKVIAQGRGGFVKRGDIFVYEPDELYLGSCPVQRLPIVSGLVQGKILGAQSIPQDIATSWAKLTNVAVEGNALRLSMP